MKYVLVLVSIFILEQLYFKFADHFNIIDKPNERSSHSTITLRGGGIVFFFGSMIYFLFEGFQYPYFFIGLTMMSAISFLDDIFTLSNKIRLFVHFVSVLLMTFQLELFDLSWYYLLICFVVVVGVINAYNFMDGINGITACYSLSVAFLLLIVNEEVNFIAPDYLIFLIISVLVFAFYNFRTTAKCFAGDVGSVAISYILLFALGLLILKTGNLIYILFLAIYGVDAVWTILSRIGRRENIFEAHRSHLYQYLANEAGINKLLVSFLYGALQFGIGYIVIKYSVQTLQAQLIFSAVLISLLSIFYLLLKAFIIKKYVKNNCYE